MQIDIFKELILKMAGHADSSVKRAVSSLVNRREDLAIQVEESDTVIDTLEIEIDTLAHQLLLNNPNSTELRFITSGMKISLDLERVGDEATTISRRSVKLLNDAPMFPGTELEMMASMVLEMLREATESFVFQDTERAKKMIALDKKVDAANKRIQSHLRELISKNPVNLDPAIHLIFVSRSLERIGDHAKNIGESVVFLRDAVDIRHTT